MANLPIIVTVPQNFATVITLKEGVAGPQGIQGLTGATGAQGPIGLTGATGADSTVPGPAGATGAQGPIGLTGAIGADSTVPGPAGATGAQGIQGTQGLQGDTGPQGPAGTDGAAGADGLDSTVPGPQGVQGVQGVQGPIGPTGPAGTTTWGGITDKPAVAVVDAAQTFAGAQRGAVTGLTSTAGSISVNLATNNNFSHTTSENTTLAAPSNPEAGQSGVITITQGATARLLAYNTFWKFPGGTVPTLTAVVGAVDVLAYSVESATRATCQLLKDVK